jgi:hypothetical protein
MRTRACTLQMRIRWARLLQCCFVVMGITKDDNLNRRFRDLRLSVVDTQMVPQYLAPGAGRGRGSIPIHVAEFSI